MKQFVKRMITRTGFEINRSSQAVGTCRDSFGAQHHLLQAANVSRPLVFDVGARYGETTARYLSIFSRPTIYSFEPFPSSFRRVVSRFAGDVRVIPQNLAISDSSGMRDFRVNLEIEADSEAELAVIEGTNSLLPRPASGRRYYPEKATLDSVIQVETITVDRFVAQNQIDHIHILKLDIQGGELMALQGARHMLEQHAVSLIYTEVMFVEHYASSPLLLHIWDQLDKYGYSLFNIFDLHQARDGQLTQADVIFISPTIRNGLPKQVKTYQAMIGSVS